MSRRFFTSDHHFYHMKMITHYGRPYFKDLAEMHEKIISEWNKTVSKKDIVYCVGDFSFGSFIKTKEVLDRLNGRKFLIRGNHDRLKTTEYIQAGFEDVLGEMALTLSNGERVLIKHYPYNINWFSRLYKRLTGKLGKWRDYFLFYPANKGKFLIHGHIHGGQRFKDKSINVSVESWKFVPVNESIICGMINEYKNRTLYSKARFYFKKLKGNIRKLFFGGRA